MRPIYAMRFNKRLRVIDFVILDDEIYAVAVDVSGELIVDRLSAFRVV